MWLGTLFRNLLVALSGADKQNVNSLHNCLSARFLRTSFVEAVFISTLFGAPLRATLRFLTSPHHTYITPRIVKCQKTRKHPSKSASRNSIILLKLEVSGAGEGQKDRGATHAVIAFCDNP